MTLLLIKETTMKITVLIENTTESELLCEHGLSVLIENNGRKY